MKGDCCKKALPRPLPTFTTKGLRANPWTCDAFGTAQNGGFTTITKGFPWDKRGLRTFPASNDRDKGKCCEESMGLPGHSRSLTGCGAQCKLSLLVPPSSSGLGYLVLSQATGVRIPVGVPCYFPHHTSACRMPWLSPVGDCCKSPFCCDYRRLPAKTYAQICGSVIRPAQRRNQSCNSHPWRADTLPHALGAGVLYNMGVAGCLEGR